SDRAVAGDVTLVRSLAVLLGEGVAGAAGEDECRNRRDGCCPQHPSPNRTPSDAVANHYTAPTSLAPAAKAAAGCEYPVSTNSPPNRVKLVMLESSQRRSRGSCQSRLPATALWAIQIGSWWLT